MSLSTRKCGAVLVTACALCLSAVFAAGAQGQMPAPSPTPAQSSAPCAAPPSCPALAPHVFQVSVNLKQNDKSLPVARKPLYLSPCPFNLEKLPAQEGRAPSRKSYYAGAK